MSLNRVYRGIANLRHASTAASTSASTSSAPVPPAPAANQRTQPTSPSSSSPSSSSSSSVAAKSLANQFLPQGAFAPFAPIPPKHNLHVATLHLRSHTTSLPSLTFFTQFALRAARALGLSTTGAVALPTKVSLYTVPRSPFAHKKSQQNFWKKEHKRAIKVYDGNPEVVNAWFAYLRKEAMGGVGQKAQTFEYKQIGWGKKMVSEEGLRLSALADEAAVKALAEELVQEMQAAGESREGDAAAIESQAPKEAEELSAEKKKAEEEDAVVV